MIVTFSTAPSDVLLCDWSTAARSSASSVSLVPRLFEKVDRAPDDRAPRRPAADHVAAERPQRLAVLGQVRARPRGRRLRAAARVAAAHRAHGRGRDLARPADPLPPAPRRARRARVRDAQVPLDAIRRRQPDEPDCLPDDTAPGGVEGDDRRTASDASCAAPRSTSCRSCSTSSRARCRSSARAPSAPSSSSSFEQRIHRYGDRHRVKAGITGWAQVQRPARTDLAVRPGRVGQLLHRELVASGST